MRKKLAAFALLCVLVTSLSACETQKPVSTINITKNLSDTITLSMFVPVGVDLGGTDSFRDLTLTYNEQHSDVKITMDSASAPDGFDSFLEGRLDKDGAVDVFVVNAENVKNIARKGQFYDMSTLENFNNLTNSAKEQAVIDDIAYTIPLNMAVYVMDVNVSLLERHSLDVPKNYDEFLNCCQVLKDNGVTPIAINRWWSMAIPVMTRSLYPIYQSENKEELIEKLNSGELKIGDYMIEGFKMFEEFLDKGYYGENLVMEEVDSIKANTQDRDDFYNSKVAFRFYPIEDLRAAKMENGDECIPVGIPMLPDGVITVPSIAARLCINANGNHIDESIDFVNYLTSQRVKLLEYDTSGNLSPFHSVSKLETDAAWQSSILELLDAGHQIPLEDMNLHFGYWDNTRKLCLAMIGGMSAEEAAKEFNRIQIEELQTYEKAHKS